MKPVSFEKWAKNLGYNLDKGESHLIKIGSITSENNYIDLLNLIESIKTDPKDVIMEYSGEYCLNFYSYSEENEEQYKNRINYYKSVYNSLINQARQYFEEN